MIFSEKRFPLFGIMLYDGHEARAVNAIDAARRNGRVLVCCALGYSRSATAVVAWLLHSGRERDLDSAIARVRQARPQMVLGHAQRQALAAMHGPAGEAAAGNGVFAHGA